MNISPYLRQVFVASSPQLAAFSVGGITGFPTVLLQQLSANGSSIPIDLDTSSWIASVHGIAGLPCLLVSLIMQWKGRKLAFILSTLLIITGWSLMMIAKRATDVIIAESFQGLGGNSIIVVSLLTVSEMVDPRLRPLSMVLFIIFQCIGMVTVSLIGYYLHWKSVSLVMFVPIMMALIMACTWPESPSWLACKGEFERCEQAFIWLRGDNIDTKTELAALIKAQKDALSSNFMKSKDSTLLHRIRRRDFYLPCIHIFLILTTFYWSGPIALFIYSVEIIKNTTGITSEFIAMAITDSVIMISCLISIVLVKIFKNKTIILFSGIGCTLSLTSAAISTYLQRSGALSSTSLITLYCVSIYSLFSTSGISTLAFNISAELMPVKHRGIGGVLYTTFIAILYTSSIKAAPYLFVYINFSGTFLVFATINMLGTFLIWKFVPETKKRTLQEIEDYYNWGSFDKCDERNVKEPFVKTKV